jgi:hypothetical protein
MGGDALTFFNLASRSKSVQHTNEIKSRSKLNSSVATAEPKVPLAKDANLHKAGLCLSVSVSVSVSVSLCVCVFLFFRLVVHLLFILSFAGGGDGKIYNKTQHFNSKPKVPTAKEAAKYQPCTILFLCRLAC